MRKEKNHLDAPVTETQAAETVATGANGHPEGSAFHYLKSLTPNFDRPALASYKRNRTTAIIASEVAETFTSNFRSVTDPFDIPVSWSMTKSALIDLLGITGHVGYEEVNGIRFYAGLNDDMQLTLIAVTTKAGVGCDDDLTIDEQYPYYDYANPCPDSCSSRGNLRAATPRNTKVAVFSE